MTAARHEQASGAQAFFRGLWEVLAFVLTSLGALAFLLVGHWDVDLSEQGGAAQPQEPPRA